MAVEMLIYINISTVSARNLNLLTFYIMDQWRSLLN